MFSFGAILPTIGMPELIIILVIALLIFGAGKLPGVGKALGKSIREFKTAVQPGAEKSEDEETIAAKSES